MSAGPCIEMSHGGGGRIMHGLIQSVFIRHFDSAPLRRGLDAALLSLPPGRPALTTDAHVISPLEFPGGDIGSLAVHGTVNDLAMVGARPLCLTAAFILEEGLPLATLEAIVASMAAAATAAGVEVVAGDTKVVERGHGDGIYIATTGLGVVPPGVDVGGIPLRAGQQVLLSGPIGDHGVAVLSRREGLDFETDLESDSAPLHDLVAAMTAVAPWLPALRDPTRGGLAATLNELAWAGQVGIRLDERAIAVRPDVAAACELLGLDPLHVANEGRLICVCEAADADPLLAAMRAHPLGRDAARIGEIIAGPPGQVDMQTRLGGSRVVDWLAGEQLPRIC